MTPAAAETVFHVASMGSDLNPGTRSKPFATLERARQAVRMAGPDKARTVVVHAGSYEMRSTFTLGRLDSGTSTRPVTWRAAPRESVKLIGGMSVPTSAWQAVTDAPLLARLDPAARGRVVQADLRALGVTNLPPFPVAYHGAPPGPELFFNESRMILARWPNEGWATIARIVESGSRPRDGDKRGLAGSFEYAGDRPSGWKAAEGVWLQGYWCYDWYDEVIKVATIDAVTRRISLAAPHVYSLMQGNPSPRRYRALNVLEELDEPGEFVIDREAGRLYLWPPGDLTVAQVTLATMDAPIIALEDASYITLQGFVVECGLDNGIEVTNGTACELVACEARDLRRLGIRVTGGTRHRVLSCDIHHTGQGGLVLGGGDRKSLTPAGHEAVNNHIWRFSEHQLTSAYGLWFEGVGNRAAHNLIHDAPHQAVFVGGNDHVFEFNEVHHVCTETDDCGALYKGRNPSCRGNLIRFNYWHDIGSPMGHGNAAVYFDDGDGGDTVFGNVFVRCGEPGKGSFGTIFSHGGHDNRAENNVFIDCKRALGSAPWDDARWRDALKGGQDCFFAEKLLQEVDITKPPYITHYPELVGYMDPPAGVPRVNHARLNLLVRCSEVSAGNWRLEPNANWSTHDDPGFVDGSRGDYRLRRDSPVFKHLPGFKPLPFEKMGLRRQ
ncbi:MAG TPA: right-handed parallel beta-helix repeat-containing protein [Verrucomicrobiae bacterium]